jgi:uncharacterized membrane protein YccC
MPQLTWRDAVFSLKTFAAAMLAVLIALRLDLPQPTWAMLTVYVVSQPLAGMVLTKSVFRVVGTVVGAVVALALVDLFDQAPEPFLLALAVWMGLCTYVSVYLRDVPAAYGAVLSGYTAAIIGLPAALAPVTAFDTAVARCLEITLGIVCATAVSRLVLPRTAGEALRTTLDACLDAAAAWTGDVLRGQGEAARGLADRRRLVADVVTLESLRVHAVQDTPEIRAADRIVRRLQARMMMLLSLLVGIHDRLAILHRDHPATAAALQPLLERAAGRIAAPDAEPALDDELAHPLPTFAAMRKDHAAVLERGVLLRLQEALELWDEARRLRRQLDTGGDPEPAPAPPFARYRDPALAMAGALVSTSSVLVAATFWIATAWSHGLQAVIFAGVACSILAALDNPAAAATSFLKMQLYGTAIAAVYVFAVLPRIDGFADLVAVLLPFYLPFGMILAAPGLGTAILPLVLGATAVLGLGNPRTVPSFADYLDTALGLAAGIGIAVLMFRLLRPLGVEWTVARLTRGMLTDLADIAAGASDDSRADFESRMFDRINALFTRLDPADPAQRATMEGSLASLRVGLNLLGLRAARSYLPPELAPAVDGALAALAHRFAALARRGATPSTLPELAAAMDRLLAAEPLPPVARAVITLDGIATSLGEHPEFFSLPGTLVAEPEAGQPAVAS